jgi:UDP-N-acetylmuramoyl-tripeptide--D-alanyl-D-alanine ligase
MPCQLSLGQLGEILAAGLVNLTAEQLAVKGKIVTDSRSVQPGQIFLALRGERFDGHEFAATAIAQGAMAVVVDRTGSHQIDPTLPAVVVEDTLQAYQAIAHWWRNQFSIPVIAVTGSVGKTTTKELIAAVLNTQGRVLKTQANYNNEIGVPKTLLELDATHNFAVIEMGMRARGEIALLTQITMPDIAVITNVGTAHIGRLGSEQAIAEAKCELLAELPATGVAVLNHDNWRLMETAATVWQGKTVTYGLDGGEICGRVMGGDRLHIAEMELPLPLPGRHNATNYLAALAVAKILGVDWHPLQSGLRIELPQGRSRRWTLPQDIVLLDETYNAGLESMIAALQLLVETPGQRHIAVLGTMKELGQRSPEFHYQVGATVRQLQLDGLLILADAAESQAMTEGAYPLKAEQFLDPQVVVNRLQEIVRPGDRILFKASRAVGLDQVVKQLYQGFTVEGVP